MITEFYRGVLMGVSTGLFIVIIFLILYVIKCALNSEEEKGK